MLSRRHLLTSAAALALSGALAPAVQAQEGGPPPPTNAVLKGAVAVTRVFGDGPRLIAVALAYDRPIAAKSVGLAGFAVAGRTVTRAYAALSSAPALVPADGNFVIIELSEDEDAARLVAMDGREARRLLPVARVTATPAMQAVEGSAVPPLALPVETTIIRNLVIDEFRQLSFTDPGTGLTLAYNLYVPADYDPARRYPLVLFMHDAGVTSPVADNTLFQGLGAVAFADPADQARHPAFVLAPQYDAQIANDQSQTTPHMEATIALVQALVAQYGLDRTRLYATGQSGGGMTAIAMNLKYPDLFAASLLVACQWDATLCAPLAAKKLWVVVAEGDTKAFPGQTAIMEVIEAAGTPVARATWDGSASPESLAKAVAAQEAEGRQINFTAFARDTVALPGQTGGAVDHLGTWRIAYGISGLRDWLLRQTL